VTRRNRFEGAEWLHFATHNVCDLPEHDSTIRHTLATALRGMDVVMWQEMAPQHYRNALTRHHPNYRHALPGNQWYDAALSVLKDAALTRVESVRFQPPHAGWSHERNIIHGFVYGMGQPSGFHVSSRHYIPKAFHPDGSTRQRRDVPDQVARHAEWERGQRIDLGLLGDLASTGFPQVAGGDWNRAHVDPLPGRIGGRRVHAFSYGLDWLHFIDGAKFRWEFPPAGERKSIRHTESDHPVLIVRARLVKR
jgi:hypothetical protein